MNIENKKQVATILLAVGLGLVAAMMMSKVVSDKVEEQTKAIAEQYQTRSATLVKEMEDARKSLKKLEQDHAALVKKVEQRPTVIQQTAPSQVEKPAVQDVAFSLRTPPGKRALTIKIDSLSAVGGLVNPGDFVDIIAHLDLPTDESDSKKQKEKDKVITVLFQNIQVLAVGTNFNPMGEAPPYAEQQKTNLLNVTLALNPEEAGLLSFAQSNGKLQLSLRSAAETEGNVFQQVASWNALADFVLEQQGTELSIPKKVAPAIPQEPEEEEEDAEPKPQIQIFRGGREL